MKDSSGVLEVMTEMPATTKPVVVGSTVDPTDYDTTVSEDADTGSGDSWSEVDRVLEELDEFREREMERVEDQLAKIKNELARIEEVYTKNASMLGEKIREQKDRLQSAESGAGTVEEEVRDRLARLYRELRSERHDRIENRRSLLMRKWELERELRELEDNRFSNRFTE